MDKLIIHPSNTAFHTFKIQSSLMKHPICISNKSSHCDLHLIGNYGNFFILFSF